MLPRPRRPEATYGGSTRLSATEELQECFLLEHRRRLDGGGLALMGARSGFEQRLDDFAVPLEHRPGQRGLASIVELVHVGAAIEKMRATEAIVLDAARAPGFDFTAFETAWTAFEKART